MTLRQQGSADSAGRRDFRVVCAIVADPFRRGRAAYGEADAHAALVAVDRRISRAFAGFSIIHRRSENEWIVSATHVSLDAFRSGISSVAGDHLITDGHNDLHITVMAGLAVESNATEFDVGDKELLVRRADAALSAAIADRLAMVEAGSQLDAVIASKTLAGQITAAGEADFRPFYQPIVSLPSGQLAGEEMVLRWRTPHGEWDLPDGFMSVADETGRIVEIGSKVIATAVDEHLATWGGAEEMPFLSVNLSRRQMVNPGLVDEIVEITSRIPPQKLWIEVSEKEIIDIRGRALTTIEELRQLGCVICVDDLGVGYSALSYLWDLPVGVVKLDRSLIQGMPSGGTSWVTFVDVICRLATTAGVSIVAEGVEDPRVIPILTDLGVHYGQGFYFGAPQPADLQHSAQSVTGPDQ